MMQKCKECKECNQSKGHDLVDKVMMQSIKISRPDDKQVMMRSIQDKNRIDLRF